MRYKKSPLVDKFVTCPQNTQDTILRPKIIFEATEIVRKYLLIQTGKLCSSGTSDRAPHRYLPRLPDDKTNKGRS
jgi:hypothetical protein